MHLDLTPIAKGVLIGLGAAVPIGPVNVEIARRTLRNGFAAGFALGAGAATVDMTYALLSCLSIAQFMDRPTVYWTFTVGGILLLGYLAMQSLRAAWKQRRTMTTTDADPPLAIPAGNSLRNGYLLGLLMTFFNPMTITFWFVALPAGAGEVSTNVPNHLPLMCIGVLLGTMGWVLTFSGTLSILGRARRDLWLLIADTIGGATLLAFALALFLRSIRPLL